MEPYHPLPIDPPQGLFRRNKLEENKSLTRSTASHCNKTMNFELFCFVIRAVKEKEMYLQFLALELL